MQIFLLPHRILGCEHYICNQCGMDFGENGKAAAKHVAGTPCVNYSLKNVQVTIPGETIKVDHKCTVCDKEERY